MNKRGFSYWIISIILALLVLILGLYWLFNDYFTGDATDMEVCKESLLIRNTLPNTNTAGIDFFKLKEKYPLKCATSVITIGYEDVTMATTAIMEQMAKCWDLFEQGEYNIYPASWASIAGGKGVYSTCYACARFHFTEEVKKYYKNNPIEIQNAMNNQLQDYGITYKQYLTAKNKNPLISEEYFLNMFSVNTRVEKSTAPTLELKIDTNSGTKKSGTLQHFFIYETKFNISINSNPTDYYIKIKKYYTETPANVWNYDNTYIYFGNSNWEESTDTSLIYNLIHGTVENNHGDEKISNDYTFKQMLDDYEFKKPTTKYNRIKEGDIEKFKENNIIEVKLLSKFYEKYDVALPSTIDMTSGDFFITLSTLTYKISNENQPFTQLIFYQWDDEIISKLEKEVKWKDNKETKRALCSNWEGILS